MNDTDLAGHPGDGASVVVPINTVHTTIDGNRFSNAISGTSGNDSIDGFNGSDTIAGGEGSDFIDDGNQSDSLSGGAGNDTLVGGSGRDILTGGTGTDLFVYGSPTDNGKQVTDFTHGQDHIGLTASGFGFHNLSEFDVVDGFSLKNNTQFLGSKPAFLYFAGNVLLQYDADGVGPDKPTYFATLTGHPSIDKNDFTIV